MGKDKKVSKEDKKCFFEQYKLLVEVVVRMNDRRSHVNRFYITILSSLYVILTVFHSRKNNDFINPDFLFFIGILGVLLSIIWFLHIWVFKKEV